MAEYDVTVELLKSTLANMTAEQIILALQEYEAGVGTELIPAELINGLPAAEGVTMTGDEMVAEINANATLQLIYERLAPIPKARVIHGENSLNYLATYDPRSSAFQGMYQAPNTDRIKKMDFIIVAGVNQLDAIFQNRDWVIALQDDPGFNYADNAKWLIMPFHKLTESTDVFRLHSSLVANSGIETISGQSSAAGYYSFAPGKETIASGEASTALGYKSKALRKGQIAEATGFFIANGDSQRSRFAIRGVTYNAIPTLLTSPSQFAFEANKMYKLIVHVIGSTAGGDYAKTWEWQYLAGINADGYVYYGGGLATEPISIIVLGTETALAASVSVKGTQYDAAGPPDPFSFKGLEIICTGINNTQVYWTAFIEAFEITHLAI